MYYKVIKDNEVIDVLDNLKYFKWQPKHKIMLLTDASDAQAILSSDGNTFWHTETLYKLPDDAPEFDLVEIVKIDKFEYAKLKTLNLKSPEEIIDNFVLSLIDNNII